MTDNQSSNKRGFAAMTEAEHRRLSSKGGTESGGFATMPKDKQREIAKKGGQASRGGQSSRG